MPYVIKPEHLAAIAGISTPLMPSLADWINKTCSSYEIDTPQEYCHFLAQACHETDHFNTLREYASGKAYEGWVSYLRYGALLPVRCEGIAPYSLLILRNALCLLRHTASYRVTTYLQKNKTSARN